MFLKGYDPLAFAVEETHKRGLQIEAWLNPYRISATANFAAFDPMHVAVQHPEWVMRYDNGSMILNPGTYTYLDSDVGPEAYLYL